MQDLQQILSLYRYSVAKVFCLYGLTGVAEQDLLTGVILHRQPFINDLVNQINTDSLTQLPQQYGNGLVSKFCTGEDVGNYLNNVLGYIDTLSLEKAEQKLKDYTVFAIAGVFLILILFIILITRK